MMATIRIRAGWLAMCACLAFASAFASADATTWQHDPATPGDWYDPANWSNGVPGWNPWNPAIIRNGGTAVIASGEVKTWVTIDGPNGGSIIQSGNSTANMGLVLNAEDNRASYTIRDNAFLDWGGYFWIGPDGGNGSGGGHFVQDGGTVVGRKLVPVNGSYTLNAGTYGDALGAFIELDWPPGGAFYQNGGVSYADSISVHTLYTLTDGAIRPLIGSIDVQSNGQFLQSGGTVEGMYEVRVMSSVGRPVYGMSGGSLVTYELIIGRPTAQNGRLEVLSPSASITVGGTLQIGPNAEFSAVAGSSLHLAGVSLVNQSASSSALGGLANLNLIVEHGPAGLTTLEAAGKDLGAVAPGWTDNFVLGTLTVGDAAAGRIKLLNDYTNQPGWGGAEAFYVENLVLNPGAHVELNNLNLYYRNGGVPKRFFVGDAFLDGDVDFADYQALETHFGATAGAVWGEGDFDGDRDVDFADYQLLEVNFAQQTPEPASLGLLAGGALALLRRRPPQER